MPEFKRFRMSDATPEEIQYSQEQARLLFRLNQAEPYSLEHQALMEQLFAGNVPEGSTVLTPLNGVCFDQVKLGRHVFINGGALMMARGGVVIDDNAMLAANVSLLTNNHDPYDRDVLLCSPIHICEGAWIGAGATIMPGVTVGKLSIVGAAAVVTHDVPDYAVVVGSPARIVKTLDPDKFPKASA